MTTACINVGFRNVNTTKMKLTLIKRIYTNLAELKINVLMRKNYFEDNVYHIKDLQQRSLLFT